MVKTTIVDRVLMRFGSWAFPRTPLPEQIAEDLRNHEQLARITQAAIRERQFNLHVTLSHIEALKAWSNGQIRTLPSDPPA